MSKTKRTGRFLDSTIWENDDFNEMSLKARFLFLALRLNSDDKGRITAKISRLQIQFFPDDNIANEEIEAALQELASYGFIAICSTLDKEYIQIADEWITKRYGATPKEDYGPNWKRLSGEAKKRDNFTCQGCGKQKKNLAAHHKISLGGGGENSLDNLITLCASCHRKAHRKSK